MLRFQESVLSFFRYRRAGLFLLSMFVGLAAGFASFAFRKGIDAWSVALTGVEDYTQSMGESTGILAFTGHWFVLISPIIAGLIIGPLMYKFGSTETGHGVEGLIYSSRRGDGSMKLGPAVSGTVSSGIVIGAGGAVGPEGPIAELGAAIGSTLGKFFSVPAHTLRILVAAGTAAGIAAAFDAPLAGTFFALEVILLDFTAETIGYVMVACVSSSVLATKLMGSALAINLPSGLVLTQDARLIWVALLGILGGIVGIAFSRAKFLLIDVVDRIWVGPEWLRPAAGAITVGLFLLLYPQMYGESSAVFNRALYGNYAAGALLTLLVVKILISALTLAVMRVGGVFAPSLFIGGMLGAALGTAVAPEDPSVAVVFGVIGMGAVFTGAARAPMTAIVLIIEMTSQYDLLLPLMLAVALSTSMSRFLTRTTIYTEELRRRGEDVDDPVRRTLVGRTNARALMQAPPAVLNASMSLAEAAKVLRASGISRLPVVQDAPDDVAEDTEGEAPPIWLGCISAVTVASARLDPDGPSTVGVLDLSHDHVAADANGSQVLQTLVSSHAEGIPVLQTNSSGERELVGWIMQEDMVRRLYRQHRRATELAEARTSFGAQLQTQIRNRHSS